MQRCISKRSASSVDLDSSSLDDVRTERAAIALSVAQSWPPVKRRSAGRPSWQQLWECALQEHIPHHHELPHGVSSQRPGWWQPGDAIARPLSHEEMAHVSTPAAPAAPAAPVAALVEGEPSGSGAKRCEIHVDPIVRDWLLDVMDQWRTERRWGMQQCLCEVRRLCPGVFDGINPNTPYRWKRNAPAAAQLDRKTSRDTAERVHHAGDRRPVLQRADDQRLGATMAQRRGTRRPSWRVEGEATRRKELRDTLQLFIKLCWQMSTYGVSEDRVVNTDETPCRLLPVHQLRGVKQAQGNTREATTFTVAFSMDRGPLDMLVQIVHAGKTDAVLPEQPWLEHPHHVTSENGLGRKVELVQRFFTIQNFGQRRC